MLTTFFSRRFIQRKCYNNVIKLSSCEKWNIFYSYIFKPARKTVVYCPKFDHLWLIVLFSFFCFLRHGLDWKMRHIGGCHRPISYMKNMCAHVIWSAFHYVRSIEFDITRNWEKITIAFRVTPKMRPLSPIVLHSKLCYVDGSPLIVFRSEMT